MAKPVKRVSHETCTLKSVIWNQLKTRRKLSNDFTSCVQREPSFFYITFVLILLLVTKPSNSSSVDSNYSFYVLSQKLKFVFLSVEDADLQYVCTRGDRCWYG